MKKIITLLVIATVIGFAYFYQSNKTQSEIQAFWQSANDSNEAIIDHSDWQEILDAYVVEDDQTGINYVAYAEFEDDDLQLLQDYIASLSAIDPRQYSGDEQQAYWINLYNALTIQLILDNYPVESITKLGKNLTSFGPWDDAATNVAGQTLSLNDIEHNILRPVWRDARVHFAVNCASIGCPNLQSIAYSSSNLDALLDKGAEEYLAHPRGMRFDGDTLVLSKIFDWYSEDFGTNENEVLNTLSTYAPQDVKEPLRTHAGPIEYEYDWGLNEY